MFRDVSRILIATLWVVVLLDLLTHGNAAIGIANALGTVWIRLLQVLSNQTPSANAPFITGTRP